MAFRGGAGKELGMVIGSSVFQVLQSGLDEGLDVHRLKETPSIYSLTYRTLIEHLLCSRHRARFCRYTLAKTGLVPFLRGQISSSVGETDKKPVNSS